MRQWARSDWSKIRMREAGLMIRRKFQKRARFRLYSAKVVDVSVHASANIRCESMKRYLSP